MTARAIHLGIDLGTTNSTGAVFDGDQVTLIRNAQGTTLTPSVVRISAKGALTVGERARRFLDSDPDNTRGEFKRLMGTSQAISFPAAKLTKRPEDLSAEVLKSIRADVEEQLGFSPVRAVISVPALFELPQSAATSEAARLAGFERVELLQEPIASALAAGWTRDSSGSWLVYDLGGGTFDVSLLETRDGLLRVVGHDGDNFLGGRDVDWAIVDWAISELEKRSGVAVSRADKTHAGAIKKLKLAAEEAKIELTRAEQAALALPMPIELEGKDPIEVDLVLDRATLERLAAPLIDRSIAVTRRLLASHGLEPSQLGKIVLVGGPTVMPALRERLRSALGVSFAEGLDPMTLVAQGAAIYAATAALDARPKTEKPASASARRLWLQYPAMTSDLTPHVVGRLVEGGSGERPFEVRFSRVDSAWQSPWAKLDAEGAFVSSVALLARRPNVFSIEARSESGSSVRVDPESITIVQGLTISDPPLSRTIGVALASDAVRVYFERGAPLPARRTFVHHTVESVAKGSSDCVLKIPIVQGELEQAHLCRLVGTLSISGERLGSSLPAGSEIELTLDLDRGGRLSARALIPATAEVFEEVAHLLVPEATPEVLETSVKAVRLRLTALWTEAFRAGAKDRIQSLAEVELGLDAVARDIEAARGGDADAAQKARRVLIDLDTSLEKHEMEKRWPELEVRARERVAWASQWIARFGSPPEQQLFGEVVSAVDRARSGKDAAELERQLRLVSDLGTAAFYRHPDAWEWMFESAASEVDSATDLPRAQALVKQGRTALTRGDTGELRMVVERLWKLLPADIQSKRLGFDSGVR